MLSDIYRLKHRWDTNDKKIVMRYRDTHTTMVSAGSNGSAIVGQDGERWNGTII